jgi:hypothetical protein
MLKVLTSYAFRLHPVCSPPRCLDDSNLAVPAAFAIGGSLAICEEYDIAEYVDSLQEHFQALDNQALALIDQQFRRNQQDWQRRRSDFSRKFKHDLLVGDLVLEIDHNPDTAWNAAVRGPFAVFARGCSSCFSHWRYIV